MKKRILSFLIACFMVVSTFIISKPLVNVHAVDGDFEEGVDQWTLPEDFRNTEKDSYGWPINGNYRLRAYDYVNDTEVNYDSIRKAKAVGGTAPSWYYNHQGQTDSEFFLGDEGKTPGMKINPYEAAAAIVFTAHASGVYEFTEIVRQENFQNASNDDGNPITDITVVWSVVKDGVTYATFTAETESKTGTLNGSVTLMEGEELLFVVTWENVFKFSWSEDWSTGYCKAYVDSLVVKKTAELSDSNYKAEVDLTPKFTAESLGTFSDVLGNVKLMGYDKNKDGVGAEKLFDTYSGKKIEVVLGTGSHENELLLIDPAGTNKDASHGTGFFNHLWRVDASEGGIIGVGGAQKTANTGSALVFTAPNDGVYYFYASLQTGYSKEWGGSYHDHIIMKGDGTVLVQKDNCEEGKTANNLYTTVSCTVSLKKDEQVLILKLVHTEGTNNPNESCNGGAEIVIKALEHVCSADTVSKVDALPPSCVDGVLEHYACYCGNNFADAELSERIDTIVDPGVGGHDFADSYTNNETEHWFVCENGCGTESERVAHVWEDGTCAVCQYACAHIYTTATCNTPATCTNCEATFGEVDMNNHASAGAYVNTGKGTHRFNRICCDDTDIAEEACTYGDDKVCDKCGYDNTALENAETNNGNALDNYLNKDNADYEDKDVTVVGPQAGDLDDYGVTGNVIEGAEYKLFNIDFDENGNMFLRHHFIIENNAKVYLNGVEVTLNNVENTNIYYFDVTPVVGKYHIADAIKVVSGESEETYNVSLYSYLKVALLDKNVDQLSDKQLTLLKSLYDLNEASKEKEMLIVGMANQTTKQVEIYDIATGNMNTPIWSVKSNCGNISGFKLRNLSPYGDVVLITDGFKAEMVSYDTKEVIWSTTTAPENSHSIELLPNGIVAVAGAAPGSMVYLFNINDDDPSVCDFSIALDDAHGVLWDPEYGVLWALGRTHLWAYNVTLGDDGSVTAVKNEELCVEMPDDHGHDLQPLYGNKDCLLVSAWKHVYIFNKATKTFEEVISENSVKGVGNFLNGDIIYMYYDGGDDNGNGGGWNTTYLTYVPVGAEAYEIPSDQGRFYKCRVWYSNYQ